jgi:ketosteroid isomerase-like protein
MEGRKTMKRMTDTRIVAEVVLTAGLFVIGAITSYGQNAAKSQPAAEKGAMSGNAEQELSQLTDRYVVALKGKDTAALERIWADDLIFTNPRGVVKTKAQRLADIQSGATRFDSLEWSDRQVRVYGDTAVITDLTTLKGHAGGQDVSGQYRTTQVLVRRGGRWQIVSLQMTPIATAMPAEKKP